MFMRVPSCSALNKNSSWRCKQADKQTDREVCTVKWKYQPNMKIKKETQDTVQYCIVQVQL